MPLLIPVIAASVGFAGGFVATEGLEKVTKLIIVGGVAYYAYTKVVK